MKFKLVDILQNMAGIAPGMLYTYGEAKAVAAVFAGLMPVHGIVVNTCGPASVSALEIPVDAVEPPIPDDAKLSFEVLVTTPTHHGVPGHPAAIGVAPFIRSVRHAYLRGSILLCLEHLDSGWENDTDFARKVRDVPMSKPFDPPEPALAVVPATADWDNELHPGLAPLTYAMRSRDFSPLGTECYHRVLGRFQKMGTPGAFSTTDLRWEWVSMEKRA